MKNFARINNYYNRIEAWKDWNALAAKHPRLAKQFAPPKNSGWRKVDKSILALRAALADRDKQQPPVRNATTPE
jgi:hypothetical protein